MSHLFRKGNAQFWSYVVCSVGKGLGLILVCLGASLDQANNLPNNPSVLRAALIMHAFGTSAHPPSFSQLHNPPLSPQPPSFSRVLCLTTTHRMTNSEHRDQQRGATQVIIQT